MLHGSTQITAGDHAVTLQPGNDGQSSQFAAPSQVVSELSFPGMLSAGDIPLWTEADERTASCSQVSICILILARVVPLVKAKKQQNPLVFSDSFRDFSQFSECLPALCAVLRCSDAVPNSTFLQETCGNPHPCSKRAAPSRCRVRKFVLQ